MGEGGLSLERERLYSELTNELLGAFYIYIQDNMNKGLKLELMKTELEQIENEVHKRNIPLKKLVEIGLEFIEKEKERNKKDL